MLENTHLLQDLLRKEQVESFSIILMVLVGLLGTILGFLMNKSCFRSHILDYKSRGTIHCFYIY